MSSILSARGDSVTHPHNKCTTLRVTYWPQAVREHSSPILERKHCASYKKYRVGQRRRRKISPEGPPSFPRTSPTSQPRRKAEENNPHGYLVWPHFLPFLFKEKGPRKQEEEVEGHKKWECRYYKKLTPNSLSTGENLRAFLRVFSEQRQKCWPMRYEGRAPVELVTAKESLPHLGYHFQIPTYLKRWGHVNPHIRIL